MRDGDNAGLRIGIFQHLEMDNDRMSLMKKTSWMVTGAALLISSGIVSAQSNRAEHPVVKPFVVPGATVIIETARGADGFKKLPVQRVFGRKVTANQKTSNDPLRTLTDGRLAEGFGPIFGNGVHDGAYKMDLGAVKPVSAITSSTNLRVGLFTSTENF